MRKYLKTKEICMTLLPECTFFNITYGDQAIFRTAFLKYSVPKSLNEGFGKISILTKMTKTLRKSQFFEVN